MGAHHGDVQMTQNQLNQIQLELAEDDDSKLDKYDDAGKMEKDQEVFTVRGPPPKIQLNATRRGTEVGDDDNDDNTDSDEDEDLSQDLFQEHIQITKDKTTEEGATMGETRIDDGDD